MAAVIKRALITGITGQDGSYLAELLLAKGYEVHGIVRREALEDPSHRFRRIQHILDRIVLHAASLESFLEIQKLFEHARPAECYHLAGHSFVTYSFDDELSTFNSNITGTHHLLSAIRQLEPGCRFYFASSSEMFGAAEESPQAENTRFRPRSSYGIAKVAGYEITRNFRETHGLHASSGILFNHESPRRGHQFVTRKITCGVAKIVSKRETVVRLGNMEARRDWGHAREYVQAMWMMLQQERAGDYVISTGKAHSVKDFAEAAFRAAGLDWRDHVVFDASVFRPAEQNVLIGDSTKARNILGWTPKTEFPELVAEMVRCDLEHEGISTRP